MNENATKTARMKAALDLMRLKAVSQMSEGKTTCTLHENDIKEILIVAGMTLDRDLEVIQ